MSLQKQSWLNYSPQLENNRSYFEISFIAYVNFKLRIPSFEIPASSVDKTVTLRRRRVDVTADR